MRTTIELFFILGWGTLEELPLWKEPAELVKMCRLVAVIRPGYPPPDITDLEKAVPGIKESITLLDMPPLDISSTDIRNRVKEGKPLDNLVPQKVARYIKEHGLYT